MDWLMKVFQNIEVLPVFPMNYLRSREQKWYRGNTTFLLTSRKTGYCCNLVWMENGGRIPWNVTAICATFKISCLMEEPYERPFGIPFNGPLSRLERWSTITLFLRKAHRDCINSVQKSGQVYSLDMRCTRRESGKET